MGIGDEIMAAGEARRARLHDPRPVCIVNARGVPRWHEVWEHNPYIVRRPGRDVQLVRNANRCRPYIDYALSTAHRKVFRNYRPMPAEIFLTHTERHFGKRAGGMIVINPTIKDRAPSHKQWPVVRWQELVDRLPDLDFAQIGPPRSLWLEGVKRIETANFRLAAACIRSARLVICHEGAVHHAAAAFSTPAVVLFGGHVSPNTTGYAAHVNLWTGNDATTGWKHRNAYTVEAMNKITVDEVAFHARRLAQQQTAGCPEIPGGLATEEGEALAG